MKFNMMIGGVETLFPEIQVVFFQEKNKMVIYFLKTNIENIQKIKDNMVEPKLILENNFLILRLKDYQYAFDISRYKSIINFYENGGCIGFAFKDENDNILDIDTPTYYR